MFAFVLEVAEGPYCESQASHRQNPMASETVAPLPVLAN